MVYGYPIVLIGINDCFVIFHYSYGFLCGIGCAMVRDTSSLMLGQYFKRRRELVETLSATGIGVGIAIFSNVYHWGLG